MSYCLGAPITCFRCGFAVIVSFWLVFAEELFIFIVLTGMIVSRAYIWVSSLVTDLFSTRDYDDNLLFSTNDPVVFLGRICGQR